MRNIVKAVADIVVRGIWVSTRKGEVVDSRRRLNVLVSQQRAADRAPLEATDSLFGSAGSWEERPAFAWMTLPAKVLDQWLVKQGHASRAKDGVVTVGAWCDTDATLAESESHRPGQLVLSLDNSDELMAEFVLFVQATLNEGKSAVVRHNSTDLMDVLKANQRGILNAPEERISDERKAELLAGWEETFAVINPTTKEPYTYEGAQVYAQEIVVPNYVGNSLDIWVDSSIAVAVEAQEETLPV